MTDKHANAIGVILTNALRAAEGIHIGMCGASLEIRRVRLLEAMHNVLVIAEQCRQEMGDAS